MPSHQERVRQNNCEHKFEWTYGIDISEMIVAAKICSECKLIVKLGYPGIADIPNEWYDYADKAFWFNKSFSQRS